MRRRLFLPLPLVRFSLVPFFLVAAWGAEPVDPVRALDLPAGDARLAAWAHAADPAALKAALHDSDPARQRGAARLLATGVLPPAALLSVLLSCPDREARRLGAAGLLVPKPGTVSLPIVAVLRLADVEVVVPVLMRHADPWAGGAARPVVLAWMKNPETCATAAALLMARGEVTVWGPDLVSLIEAAEAPEVVVAAAHAVLERLTATQRNRDTYAGHRDVLAKDWRDVLAQQAEHPPQPDADLLALIAELPAPAALDAILKQGPTALPALEQAMAGAERSRRKILQPVARLVARGVTPYLWEKLGESGLADLDADDARARSACLRRIAAAVRDGHDAPGLIHLLRWLDDRDDRVRATALDLLVRLSDEHEHFGKSWEVGEDQLFPPSQTIWRLRRCLRDGGHEERLAALLLVGSLRAEEFLDDVTGLLIDGDPLVAEAALDALGRLSVTEALLPILTRIALDQSLPSTRRVLACTRIASVEDNHQRGSSDAKSSAKKAPSPRAEAITALHGLLNDPLSLVANAAAKALLKLDTSASGRKEMYTLLADSGRGSLLKDTLANEEHTASLVLMLPYLAHEDASSLAIAQGLIASMTGSSSHDRKNRIALQSQITTLAQQPQATVPQQLVGLVYGVGRSAMMQRFATFPESVKAMAWNALVEHMPRTSAAWLELVPLAAEVAVHDRVRLVRKAWVVAVLEPQVFLAVVEAEQTSLLESSVDENHAGGRTIILDDAVKVSLTGKPSAALPGEDPDGDDDHQSHRSWTFSVPPPGLSAAETLALRTALQALVVAEDDQPIRDLLVAIFGGADPAFHGEWQHDLEVWAVLAKLRPALRPRLIAALMAAPADSLNDWSLRRLPEPGNADLLPLIAGRWATTSEWERGAYLRWMRSLPAEALRPHLAALVAVDVGRDARYLTQVIRRSAPIPLPAAVRLLQAGKLTVAVEPSSDAAELTTALAELTPATILAQSAGLVTIRSANPELFDKVLAGLCTQANRNGAAWLRGGLPLQYLGRAPYDAAFTNGEPHLWVVGAALRLKEETLSPGDFLAKLPSLPPTALSDALQVAQRRLAGRLADQGPALAAILHVVAAGEVAAWVELCPPHPAVAAELRARLAAGLPANLLTSTLAGRLRSDQVAWEPLVRDLDGVAKGQFTTLLGTVPMPVLQQAPAQP